VMRDQERYRVSAFCVDLLLRVDASVHKSLDHAHHILHKVLVIEKDVVLEGPERYDLEWLPLYDEILRTLTSETANLRRI